MRSWLGPTVVAVTVTVLVGCTVSSSDDGGSGVTTGGSAGQLPSVGGASSAFTGGSSSGGTSTGGVASGGLFSGGASSGGGVSTGGTSSGGASGSGGSSADPCADPGLSWKTAHKTNYTSYPDPGSEECIKYNGCTWAGQFATCSGKKSEAWVEAHDIAALFPLGGYGLHDICIKSGTKTMVVTVYDTCGDSDCSGCCTQNKGSKDALVDLESYTNARWGLPDGAIEWADLGPTTGSGCD